MSEPRDDARGSASAPAPGDASTAIAHRPARTDTSHRTPARADEAPLEPGPTRAHASTDAAPAPARPDALEHAAAAPAPARADALENAPRTAIASAPTDGARPAPAPAPADDVPLARAHASTDAAIPPGAAPGAAGADADLAPGTAVGAFAIAARLSAGGFGTVYRATGPRGEPVAVKVLHAHLAANPATVARFEREFRAVASLAHPGIVRVIADGRLADGRPWFAMELLEGRELEEQLQASGRCAPAACLRIVRAIADALAAAHAHGIIHRDIKASNVFVTADRIVLLDFGVAKLLDLGDEALTATGATVGTPASMAPEQARGGPVDARTDVYGLGALLFHMLTGTKPFGGHETHELRFLHQHARRPRPSSRAAVPDALDAIVGKAMAIDPAARYATPGALAAALEQALGGAAPADAAGAPLYLLAELATVDDSLAAPSEALWDDLEAVRATLHELARPPYVVHLVTDTAILVERRGDAATVERVLEDCRTIADRLRARPAPHAAVRVRLVVADRPPSDEALPHPDEPVVIVPPRGDRS